VLCVLGIWSRCVETVIADLAVETYAISEKDFFNLFTAEADLNSLEEVCARVGLCIFLVTLKFTLSQHIFF
jgi:hypothetical protein